MNKDTAERQAEIRKLIKNYFTPASALFSSEVSLLRLDNVGITKSEADIIILEAAKLTLTSQLMCAREAQVHERLTTGCPNLDTFFQGGVALQGITEIAGSSGCGKTQFCLQLLLTVQLPEEKGGKKAGAVYISTEDSFPTQRLQQLIQCFSKADSSAPKFGDNIFIEHIADADQMLHCLEERLPQLLSHRKIKLIVLDSIAGIFRGSYNLEDCQQRAETLRRIGGILHLLAHKHGICIICINQVTANMKSTRVKNESVPSLGLAWANLVTTRLLMSRSDPVCNFIVRTLEIIFSPYLPNKRINFTVSESGVKGVED